MNILVIGNGFDIAHGLKTSYSDFLEFAWDYQNAKDVNEELKRCISDNLWLDYFVSIYEERKVEGKDGWIDFESEICLIIEALDRAMLSYYGFINNPDSNGKRAVKMDKSAYEKLNMVLHLGEGNCFYREKSIYINHIKQWKQILLRDLNKLTRGLEIYLCDYLEEDKLQRLPIIEKIKADYVLSFNYTRTYEKLYSKPNGIDYIHGVINSESDLESNNMVLGIGEFLVDERKDNDNKFVEFKKFYQRIYKSTGSSYKKWLTEFEEYKFLNGFNQNGHPYQELNIYFYGHSLDPTDGDILLDLFDSENANIYIYHHSKDALSKQIANLIRVIGEERTIELTDKSEGRIKFLKC